MNKIKLSLLTSAILACGYASANDNVAQTPTKANAVQQVEESYYEDSEDFNAIGAQSSVGWGWSKNASKDPLGLLTSGSDSETVIITDDPETDIEPPAALTVADYITYSPFTALGNVDVKWATVSGSSSITYTLQSQKDNGSWTTVYTGGATSKAFSGLTDGAYKYRVKGCTSTACSPYQEYVHMQVKTANNNLIANAMATKREATDKEAQVPMMRGFTVPKLGYAYDMVRGEPKSSHCWDVTTDSQIVGSTTTAIAKELSYTIANSSEELATQLELNASVDLSAEYGGYSAEYQYTKQLFSKTRSAKDTSVIVAKLKDTRSQIVAKSEPTLNLSTFALSQLSTNKSNFRNDCGDKYVDRVTMGRFAYVTIKVSADGKTQEQLTTTTNQLKVDLKLAEGAYNNSTSAALSSTYYGYTLDIFATVIGSGAEVVKLTDMTALVGFLGDFESSTNDTLYPIGHSQKFYNIPAVYNTTDHFSVFTDYRTYSTVLGAWATLDRQVAERCYYFDHKSPVLTKDQVKSFNKAANASTGLIVGNACGVSKRIIATNISNCASHQTWADCVLPVSSQCIDSLTGTQCMVNPNLLPVWDPDVKISSLWVRAPGGCWSNKDKEGSVTTCLAPNSVLDYTKQWNVGSYSTTLLSGFGTTQTDALRVRKVTHTPTVQYGDTQCVVSYAKARCSGRFGGGPGGWYGSDQTLQGLSPTSQPYYF